MSLNNEKLPLSTLMFRLRRLRYFKKKRSAESARMKKSMSIVEERLGKWVDDGRYRVKYGSMDEILDELGITGDELRLYCSRTFQKSFLSWRKDLRMEDAKKMLLDFPDMPSGKIGNILGISDRADFRHQFKSATGMTPSRWREKFSRK